MNTKINVGIDIAKTNHYASIIDANGEVLVKPFKFTNDITGFKILESKLLSYSKEDIIIGFESTAHYANSLMIYFFNKGYTLTMINPLKTHALRNINIRGAKNDKIDSTLIATFLLSNEYEIITKKFIDLIELKTLTRNRQNIVTSITRSKIKLKSCLDQIFPEYAPFFGASVYGSTSFEILKSYQNPNDIAKINLTKLSNIFSNSSNSHYDKNNAIELKKIAKNSIGLKNSSLELEIKHCIEQIELLTKQKAEIEKEISNLLPNVNSNLINIKGIGQITAATIIAEIGDINRFKNSSKLLAFAGLDPKIKQSGNFNATSVSMSKRGSRALRYSLIFASENLAKYTKTFNEYYNKKRSEGKSHYQALGHCAGKFVRILYYLLKSNEVFTLE